MKEEVLMNRRGLAAGKLESNTERAGSEKIK
jgi:hypothetical protein